MLRVGRLTSASPRKNSLGGRELLSGVALAIWRVPDDEADPAAIKSIVSERFEVDPATCDLEVDHFIDELEQARFLVTC